MPKRTGLKTNQEPHQRLYQDEIKTRHLKNQIARVNLQESHNNHNNENPFGHDDSKYIIKRHIIQHHQSIIVPNPNMYLYQPYYNPSFMQHPQNSRDILQQLTVENVKRVVREKQLDFLPFQQIHNTITSMIEYEQEKDPNGKSSGNRQHRKDNLDDEDEIILEGIRILSGPQPKTGNVTNVNSINISVTPERVRSRHSKNANITVTKPKEHTEKPQTNTTAATNSSATKDTKEKPVQEEDDYEYEDEDDNFEIEDETGTNPQENAAAPKPAGSYTNKDEAPPEDQRFNLGTFGWHFNRSKDNTGDGIFVQQLKVRRGGVAIAGPGGIATAGSGGTAIVGPGGFAYTHPGSVAIAGSGSQVVAVDPDVSLSDIVNNNKRNRTRPGLFSNRPHRPPRVGRVVAVGPVIYYNRG